MAVRILALSETEKRGVQALEDHAYGLVYAVKLTIEDLKQMKLDLAMGLQAFHDVGAEKIIGKALVPNTFEQRFGSRTPLYAVSRSRQWAELLASSK